PSKEFLDVARDALKAAGLPGGCLSAAYLSNMARHAKHLLGDAIRASCREAVTRCVDVIARDPRTIIELVAACLAMGAERVPADITRATSRQLTRRVKERARGRGVPVGKHRLDAVIDSMLAGQGIEEMARQVATRIVAACVHHGVELLRFEDLSWSSHASKRESGSWLASWQVHWFFSQVQDRATRLARLAGIAVELVDARGTSKRCSACGAIGVRDGKTFTCTNEGCEMVVDSDLNGARNVRIAPASPRLHAKGGDARYRPLACLSSTNLSLEEPGLDVQVRPSLK
ncbi:MAG: zinc ribbon domain-containing protein, partial [Candidatus Sigynarchaeota archaeon]